MNPRQTRDTPTGFNFWRFYNINVNTGRNDGMKIHIDNLRIKIHKIEILRNGDVEIAKSA